MRKNLAKGFNFLELMIALAILGILFLLTIPIMRDLMIRNRVSTNVNRIFSALQFAKGAAMTLGETITFCKSANHKECGGDWSSGAIVLDENSNVLQSIDFLRFKGDKLNWFSSFGKNDTLKFLPSGLSNGQQGSFLYCPCKKSMRQYAEAIIVNIEGRIYVSKKTAEGQEIPC